MTNEKYIGFSKLKSKLSHQKGVTDQAALAASIGRKKYGKQEFQKMASKGRNESYELIEAEINEILAPSMGVKSYIDDFIKSKDSRFSKDSIDQRRKRAIAAFYSDKRK